MKGLRFILGIVLVAFIMLEAVAGVSITPEIMGSGGPKIAIAALATQKIVFMKSLKEEYDAIETWLDEVDDLSAFVKDGQTLVFPEAGEDPAVYKNRVTDVDSVEPTETTHEVVLDVYDSQNYKLRNIFLHALPFEKIQYYTKKSSNAIKKAEIRDAAYTFAPPEAGNKRIILPTTGTIVGGYKQLTLDDIITMAKKADEMEFPDNRNLVLPSDMWWGLINSNEILKGQLERTPQNGIIDPKVVNYYGFKIHKSLGNKLGIAWDISAAHKAPQGAVITGDVVPAGLIFCSGETFKAGGGYDMFYKEKSTNTKGRAHEFGFQHRFKADFQMSAQRYSGLIYADQ